MLRSKVWSPRSFKRTGICIALNVATLLTLTLQCAAAPPQIHPTQNKRFIDCAARRLRGNPGFTTIGVLTLALGIGAGTAIFSVVDGVLLKPLPYPQSGRIVALRHTAPGIHIEDLNMAASLYFTYSDENRVFQDVGMWQADTASVTGIAQPEEAPLYW